MNQGTPPAGAAAQSPPVPPQTAPAAPTAPAPAAGPESWGSKVYHGVLNALGGSSDVSLARDPATGKMVATAVKSGPGQQWKRIISGALSGFGAASQVAPGPGQMMRGAGAGVNAGMQKAEDANKEKTKQANENFEAQQKAATSDAQNALLSHQITQLAYTLGRAQVAASEQDLARESDFIKNIADGGNGSTDMGVFPDFASVVKAFREMPQMHDHQAQGKLVTTLHTDANGKIDGVHAALVTSDWLAAKIPNDLPLHTATIEDGKLVEKTFTIPAGTLTGDQYVKLVMGQTKDSLDQHAKDADEQRKDEDLKLKKSRTTAENAESYASAGEHSAKAAQANAIASGGGDAAVDLIGRGQMDVKNMAYLLGRNPAMADEIAKRYPGFDSSKVSAYANTYKEFTSLKNGSPGQALNAGATVLKHLRRLSQLNTKESHIPGTNDYTAYQNQLGTLVPELGRFYGNDTIPGLASYRDTLGSTLPGNRQKAIETQAHAMGEKFDSFVQSWRNAAPSAAYQAKMPGIDPEAIDALKTLNPLYPESKTAELMNLRAGMEAGAQSTQQPAAQPGALVKITPGEPQAMSADGVTPLVVRGGQWVPAQH